MLLSLNVRVVHMYTDRVPTERQKMRVRPSQARFVNYPVQYDLVFLIVRDLDKLKNRGRPFKCK